MRCEKKYKEDRLFLYHHSLSPFCLGCGSKKLWWLVCWRSFWDHQWKSHHLTEDMQSRRLERERPLTISLSPKRNPGITSSGLLVLETVNVFYFEQLVVILLYAAKSILNDKLKGLASRGQHNTSSCNSGTQRILENRFESWGQGITMIAQRCFPAGNCGEEFGSQQSSPCKS